MGPCELLCTPLTIRNLCHTSICQPEIDNPLQFVACLCYVTLRTTILHVCHVTEVVKQAVLRDRVMCSDDHSMTMSLKVMQIRVKAHCRGQAAK